MAIAADLMTGKETKESDSVVEVDKYDILLSCHDVGAIPVPVG
jgi:hypothetical protein